MTSVLQRLRQNRLAIPASQHMAPRPTRDSSEGGSVRTKLRIQQAIEHDGLWTAFDDACHHPEGTRMKRIASHHPDAFALFNRYPKLEALKPEIERANKLTMLVEASWRAISGTTLSQLFRWREKAGLPRRKPR